MDKIGAGPFNGLVITGNILTSLALDAFGLFGLPGSGFKLLPWIGGLLMVGGIVFIARTSAKDEDGGEEEGLAGKLLFPFILVAGALQALGVAWNAQLNHALMNPWLAATVSFLPVVFVFALVFLLRPVPLPTARRPRGRALVDAARRHHRRGGGLRRAAARRRTWARAPSTGCSSPPTS